MIHGSWFAADRMKRMRLWLLAILIFMSFPAAAATITWDGGGIDADSNNRWDNPLNWSGDVLPSSTDDVVFDGSRSDTIDIAGTTAAEIRSLTVTSDFTGTIDGNFWTITTTGDAQLDGGTFTGALNIICGGDFNRSSSQGGIGTLTLQKTEGTLNFTLNPSESGFSVNRVNLSSNVELLSFNEVLELGSSMTIESNARFETSASFDAPSLFVNGEAVFNNVVSINNISVQSVGSLTLAGSGTIGSITNNQLLTLSSNISVDTWNNILTANVEPGVTVTVNGTFSNSGTIELSNVSSSPSFVDARTVTSYSNSGEVVHRSVGSAVRRRSTLAGFIDADGNPIASVAPTESVYVTLIDESANENGDLADQIPVTISVQTLAMLRL